MTDTEIILAFLCVGFLVLAALALMRWVMWSRIAGRLYEQSQAQQETIGRLWNENRPLREREGHRRVFGTAPLSTEELGDPVG